MTEIPAPNLLNPRLATIHVISQLEKKIEKPKKLKLPVIKCSFLAFGNSKKLYYLSEIDSKSTREGILTFVERNRVNVAYLR